MMTITMTTITRTTILTNYDDCECDVNQRGSVGEREFTQRK